MLSNDDITPKELETRIRNWLKENSYLNIEIQQNPESYFSLKISFKNELVLIPIYLSYPKQFESKNILIVGWGWKLTDLDTKTFKAIKDVNLKKDLINKIKSKLSILRFHIEIEPNEYEFEIIRVWKYLSLEKLSKENLNKYIIALEVAYNTLMSEFESHNMSRATFDASEYI